MKHKSLISVLLYCFCLSVSAYDWQTDLQHRLRCDFDQSRESVVNYIRQYIPHVTDEQIARWEETGALEQMILDGEKVYFSRAGRNLFRIDPQCVAIWNKTHHEGWSDEQIACMKNIPQILRDAPWNRQHIAQARRIRVTYTLTVNADAVPAGERIRCWLPYPRQDQTRQTDVELISASQQKYQFSDPKCVHSTLYMEQKAVAGQPTVFQEVFEFTTHGAKFDLSNAEPYDKKSSIYRKYTAEREKHVVFTPQLRALSDSLTAGLINPVEKARNIWLYIDANYPWASARNYSTIENIPMYVLQNRHGDCGQVVLLFITLCRIAGIPARWQSGFQVHPWAENMHDWAEVYFEGIGWVPVDQSYGITPYGRNEAERMFYFGGIDSWRLIVNSDYGMPLSPKKKYPCSDTVDFQRGEVEWAKGNVYYDEWTNDMEVEYLD